MTAYFVLRTTSGLVRFRINAEAREDEPVLVREEETMIPIEREPPDMGPHEECCFCYKPTPFWTALPERKPGAQVACCRTCAKKHEPHDVPTKRTWMTDYKKRHPRW